MQGMDRVVTCIYSEQIKTNCLDFIFEWKVVWAIRSFITASTSSHCPINLSFLLTLTFASFVLRLSSLSLSGVCFASHCKVNYMYEAGEPSDVFNIARTERELKQNEISLKDLVWMSWTLWCLLHFFTLWLKRGAFLSEILERIA